MAGRLEPPWAALTHAYGSAVDVPGWLRGLRDPARASERLDELFGSITHQGTRYSATPSAIPYLVDVATDSSAPNRPMVLGLIHFAAFGFTGDHLDWQRQRDRQTDGYERACGEAVAREQDRIRPLLLDGDPAVVQVALAVLAWSGDASRLVLERIAEGMSADTDGLVGACYLASTVLGRLPDGVSPPAHPVGPGPLAAFGSAIAALRFSGERATLECVTTLRSSFDHPSAGDDFSSDFLVGDHPSRWAANALADLPDHLRSPTIDLLTADVGRGFVTGVEPLTAVLRLILDNSHAPASPSELSHDAVEQLTAVATAVLSWGPQRPSELGDVGLPSSGQELLTWLRAT